MSAHISFFIQIDDRGGGPGGGGAKAGKLQSFFFNLNENAFELHAQRWVHDRRRDEGRSLPLLYFHISTATAKFPTAQNINASLL